MRMPERDDNNDTASIAQDEIDLVLELQRWSFNAAPAQMYYASLIFALVFVGGIAGRSYNIKGSGLAQYWLLIARSGTGKGIIQKCLAKLFAILSETVPAIIDFKGPGHIASGQGLLKWLASKPYPIAISILDEFGETLKEMSNRRNVVAQFIRQVLLQLWALGGANDVCDPMAYSDVSKNTNPIKSPSLTIAALTTPTKASEAFTDDIAYDGVLGRFNVLEHTDKIPDLNEAHQLHYEALPYAVQWAAGNLVAESLRLARSGQVRDVEVAPEAELHFSEYAKAVRQRRNSMPDMASELLGRNVEKAWKLAATLAVGRSPYFPCIQIHQARWATDFIDENTDKLIAKFVSGEVGEVAGNEAKQLNEAIRVISEYVHSDFDTYAKYGGGFDMHAQGVITEAHILRRLHGVAAFKNDKKAGPTNAVKRAIKSLLDADELREMPPSQMLEKYGKKPRAYVVADPHRFRRR